MTDFENEHDPEQEEKREEQIKEDRFTSLMFGPKRGSNGARPHHREEPRQNTTIDYEELMMNIDTLLDSLRGFKPLIDKVYPYIQQIWKKK